MLKIYMSVLIVVLWLLSYPNILKYFLRFDYTWVYCLCLGTKQQQMYLKNNRYNSES